MLLTLRSSVTLQSSAVPLRRRVIPISAETDTGRCSHTAVCLYGLLQRVDLNGY